MQISGRPDRICHSDCKEDATKGVVLNMLFLGRCPEKADLSQFI